MVILRGFHIPHIGLNVFALHMHHSFFYNLIALRSLMSFFDVSISELAYDQKILINRFLKWYILVFKNPLFDCNILTS